MSAETIKIPGYRIERKLGQGGMAAVYLAIQESFEREVALKIMSPLLNSDPSFTTRFIREARIVAHIHHASIVPVFDVGEHQPYHYLSMEYLPGGDLKHRILKGRCNSEQVMSVCVALCGALDVAHRKGFVHRDIKPENVLFREDGTPVLTDFGIARAVDRGASLTVAGMLVGTPSYMSPEQVKGIELDGRSDLYSLGIVCYEMLTGTVPFRADSTMSVALKHLSDPMPPLPPDLGMYQSFIDRLTAKDVKDRYANGSEAVQALRSLEGRAATSDATMMRPMPAEITALLAAQKTARRRPFAAAMTSLRAGAAGLKAGVARAWERRPRLSGARALWDKMPKAGIGGLSPAWTAVAGALVLVVAVGVVLALRSTPSAKKLVAASTATPVVAPPAPVAAPPPAVMAPEIMPETAPTDAEAQTAEVTPVPDAQTVDPAAVTPDPAAEAARAKQAEARKKRDRLAKQRIEEITREREAAVMREQDDIVLRLLAAAKGALAAGKLTGAAGESAADRYREILKLRPNHPEATAGLQRIADLLVDEAQRERAVGNTAELRKLVGDITKLNPDHRTLPELEVALADLEASPKERSRREAATLERVKKSIDRAYVLLDHKPYDMRTAEAATNQYDIGAGIMPMAPGLPVLKERLIASYAVAVRTEMNGKDPKRAVRLIASARKRKWMTPELEELERALPEAQTVLSR